MSIDIIGQERPVQILSRAIEHDRLAHAYLFTGPEGVGKSALAFWTAQSILCEQQQDRPCGNCGNCHRVATFSHPDVRLIFPAPKSMSVDDERDILDRLARNLYGDKQSGDNPVISIDRIRELRRITKIKPTGKYRIIVLSDADRMTMEASNSLLKILEEPPESTYLILTSARPNTLLPTILSRCQEIRFGLLPESEIQEQLITKHDLDPERARLISRIAQGSYGHALNWLDHDVQTLREEALEALRSCFKDPLSQITLIEKLVQTHDKQTLNRLLGLIQIWLRDALLLRQSDGGNDEQIEYQIVNIDQLDTLIRFVKVFDHIDFDALFTELDTAKTRIQRNVNIQLIFTVLLLNLKMHFTIKGQPS